jgi:5-methylcytosine-specific restriction enzyme subunit McrC
MKRLNEMPVVREFGYLSRKGSADGMDHVLVPEVSFEWLKQQALTQSQDDTELFRLASHHGQECLQVLNYTGLLQTPDGCRVEILPRTTNNAASADAARKMLWRMLTVVYKLGSSDQASPSRLPEDCLEILISSVLGEINQLVHRGIRSDPVRTEEQTPFRKGQWQVARQLRLRAGQQTRFCNVYNRDLPDRPENRLIRLTLEVLQRWTRHPANQRLCQQLLFVFKEIPESKKPLADIARWSIRRDMAHYSQLLPMVRLILAEPEPIVAAGSGQGISLLFPMERLFEEYVTILLRRKMLADHQLLPQTHTQYLVSHQQQQLFQLRPDLLVQRGAQPIAVLNTKWKLLDGNADNTNNTVHKHQLKQSDLYQLFAYGEKYLGGQGELFLIYPMHEQFSEPLPVFEFKPGLRLWVVPFDLARGELLAGDWLEGADWYRHVLAQVA